MDLPYQRAPGETYWGPVDEVEWKKERKENASFSCVYVCCGGGREGEGLRNEMEVKKRMKRIIIRVYTVLQLEFFV